MKKYAIFAILTFAFIGISTAIWNIRNNKDTAEQLLSLDSLLSESGTVNLNKEGKDTRQSRTLRKIYTKSEMDSLHLPAVSDKLRKALQHQLALLKKQHDSRHIGDLEIQTSDLEKVVALLTSSNSSADVKSQLEAYQISGADQKGNVRFTGYYAPVVDARYKSIAGFSHPVYIRTKKNDGTMTVVYVKNAEEVRNMRIEGVSFLKLPDGQRFMVAFNGDYENFEREDVADAVEEESHAEPQKVLAKYSAVFSQKDKNTPFGADRTPLTSDVTIAVDRAYIPLGAVVLAQVPIIDGAGNLVRHEYRLLVAQDVGSAIRGAGHVDLYMGEGNEAKEKSRFMNKFGKIWILLPKNKSDGSMAQKM